MNTHQKGWIMKRIALLVMLVALFFGTVAATSANPSYYVRWDGNPHYECDGLAGIDFGAANLDYYAAIDVTMIETDIIDTPAGRKVITQPTQTGWRGLWGKRQRLNMNFWTDGWPITFQAILKTYDHRQQVYTSTLTAICNGTVEGGSAQVVNPLVLGLLTKGSPGIVRP